MKFNIGLVDILFSILLLKICVRDVQTRQIIKPPADLDVKNIAKVIGYASTAFSELTDNADDINDNYNDDICSLNVQKDLPKSNEPQPLYLVPNTDQIWATNKNGYLEIPHGSHIELHCTSSFANTSVTVNEKVGGGLAISAVIPKNTQTIKLTCLGGRNFVWQGQKYQFHQFQCKRSVWYTVERTGEKCAQFGGNIFRVGFNITQERFIETMRICYDVDMLRSHYTQYKMLPGNMHFQRYVKRLNFSKAGFFEKHNMNSYYTQKNQVQQALKILAHNATIAQMFNTKELFLARGHLAAKADFVYANQQRATFTFFNVAPQWQSFNGGQWAALEDEIRKFVFKRNLDVDCYTGTWGTLNLKPGQPFYLAKDENNNDILPVPQLYFRIIIDRNNSRRGIALLGVNNPHVTLNEIQSSYIICENIAENIAWLHWIRNKNIKKGFIYACNVDDFFSAVTILPENLRNVNETLL